MPSMKPHLEGLHRTAPKTESRLPFLRLDMNENPDGLPAGFVRDVLTGIDADYLSAYPEYAPLAQKIAVHNAIAEDNIIITNGSDGAIKTIFEAFVSPGDTVLFTDPTFAMYPIYCGMFNAKPLRIPYKADLSFPTEPYLDAIGPQIAMAVVVNPNNPTGSVLTTTDMERILDRCLECGVLLIMDEAYYYYYNGTAIRRISDFPNLLVLRTFSKICGLAAARIGYAAGDPKIIQQLFTVKPSFDTNGVAVRFAEALLDHPEIVNHALSRTRQGMAFLIDQFQIHGIPFRDGHANFVLVHIPDRVSEMVTRLKKNGVLVGGGFSQEHLKNYLRVTVGSKEKMEQFLKPFLSLWSEIVL
jgi:histidinol-phosphate aminotransferase